MGSLSPALPNSASLRALRLLPITVLVQAQQDRVEHRRRRRRRRRTAKVELEASAPFSHDIRGVSWFRILGL